MGKSTTIEFPHLHVLLEGFIEDLDFVFTSIKSIEPIDQSNRVFLQYDDINIHVKVS